MYIKHVLITGARAPAALELARIFSRRGHRVHMADSIPYPLSKASRHVEKYHRVRTPKQQTDGFIDDILHLVRREKIDVLIPTCEEIFYLSAYKQALEAACEVFVEPADRLLPLHNKFTFIETASAFGLPVPETRLCGDKVEWHAALAALKKGERWIGKPVYTRFSNDIVQLPKEAGRQVDVHPQKKWIVQAYIEGSLVCTYSIASHGQLLAHSVYYSKFRAGDGASVHFQAVDEPAVDDWVETFVRKYRFHGQIAFDFIKTPQGDIYPIECNPRLTSGVHLFRSQDLPSAFMGQRRQLLLRGQGKVALTPAMLLFGYKNIRMYGWKDFFDAFKKSEDAIFERRDWKPFFYQFLSLYYFWKTSRKNKTSILEATTHDISWDG
ncbi:ATP-grasp domain-containing protein [Evansella caseinilytica]|uniref:ATP-grasp domain-containing protein n=1 Tax=Evansella caseinilytica TaxID=1503961 RepID=A0A1H3IPN2_9BACI|nr:ATP-grasp domain-containing protein [Evansella caseinilytica]SDY29068.1 ATP-grasp domain-containing protein [Evansella caseinilytica]